MKRLRTVSHTTFASLEVPNYRRYVSGQSISLIGTWMQMTVQSWLVLTLTHSATMVGVIVACQTLPVLVLAPYGGVLADRLDKRKLMIGLQTLMGVQALALGILTITHVIQVWEIGILASLLGFNNAFENPARQSFMLELVGPEHLRNAVSLNSTMVNLAKVVGPAIGGLLIAAVGSGYCFLLNAVTFVFVVGSLLRMETTLLNPTPPMVRGKGQLREGFAYVRRTPSLLIPLMMAGVVGCLTFEFQVSLPYVASRALHGGSSGYGFLVGAMGLGAVAGGLVIATRGKTGIRPMTISAFGFGIAMAAATFAPSLAIELVVLLAVGWFSVSFMSMSNATLQLGADPSMRGRVMALWFVAFQGSTPIGGPIVGAVMSGFGPRSGLGLGAVTCFAVAGAGALALGAARPRRRAAAPDPSSAASRSDIPRAADAECDSRETSGALVVASVPRVRGSAPAARRDPHVRR